MRAVVIGGGISGLAAAYYLQREAKEHDLPLNITLIEGERRLGGKIRTERDDGFILEGGPDSFVSTKPWAVELCTELGIEHRLMGSNSADKAVFVLQGGKLVSLPEGLSMMIPSKFWPIFRSPLLSRVGKLRLALDLILPARRDREDETIGGLVTRRLGREAFERLIEPLLSGIYAGDGDRLSVQATFPWLKDLELRYGGLTRGALALRRATRPAQGSPARGNTFLTFPTGLSELSEALAGRLSEAELMLGDSARALTRAGDGYAVATERGGLVQADVLILATPAYVTAKIVRACQPGLAELLGEIEFATTATVSLAYRQPDLPSRLNGHGYAIPRLEGRLALACTWTSTKFPGRAPEGYALLRVFLGRAGTKEQLPVDAELLCEAAREEVASTLHITSQPLLTRVHRWPRGMPQYNLGHPQRLTAIQHALEKLPGVFLAGASYRGVGIPDCIYSGKRAAEGAIAYFCQEQVTSSQ